MNSSIFDSTSAFGSDWDNNGPDTSEFLYDSPVPHNHELTHSASTPTPSGSATADPSIKQEPPDPSRTHLSVPTDRISQQSSNSTTDSRSSSSASPNQQKLPSFHNNELPSHGTFGKLDSMFEEDETTQYGLGSGYPSVNSDMNHLSLNNPGSFDFSSGPGVVPGIFANEKDLDMAPRTFGAMKNVHASPVSPCPINYQHRVTDLSS